MDTMCNLVLTDVSSPKNCIDDNTIWQWQRGERGNKEGLFNIKSLLYAYIVTVSGLYPLELIRDSFHSPLAHPQILAQFGPHCIAYPNDKKLKESAWIQSAAALLKCYDLIYGTLHNVFFQFKIQHQPVLLCCPSGPWHQSTSKYGAGLARALGLWPVLL